MQRLNEQKLRSLVDTLVQEEVSSPSKPAIIEYQHCTIFIDGGILLEWPHKLVDNKGPLYQELFAQGQADQKMQFLREAEHWAKALLGSHKFHPVQEAEPDDNLKFIGCMDFICRTRRCHYRAGYIVAVEETVDLDKLNYSCHIPENHEDMVMLTVFEGMQLVGVVANEV